jgi:hypothetical protein
VQARSSVVSNQFAVTGPQTGVRTTSGGARFAGSPLSGAAANLRTNRHGPPGHHHGM